MSGGPTAQERRTIIGGIAASFLVAAALWWLLLRYLPEPGNVSPVQAAVGCIAVAALLTLFAGIEAIAHERFVTRAVNPLAGVETPRLRVNFRYLSNTVEQFIVFAAGLLGIAAYCSPRLLVIVTIVWVLARWAFWIGYHKDPLWRAVGAPGMLQSLLVLLYVAWRFGRDSYGSAAGIALVIAFLAIEAILVWAVTRRS
jgi:MAPEG family